VRKDRGPFGYDGWIENAARMADGLQSNPKKAGGCGIADTRRLGTDKARFGELGNHGFLQLGLFSPKQEA